MESKDKIEINTKDEDEKIIDDKNENKIILNDSDVNKENKSEKEKNSNKKENQNTNKINENEIEEEVYEEGQYPKKEYDYVHDFEWNETFEKEAQEIINSNPDNVESLEEFMDIQSKNWEKFYKFNKTNFSKIGIIFLKNLMN